MNVTTSVRINNGVGKLLFPHNLKQRLNNVYCICHAVKSDQANANQTLHLHCDASYFREQDQSLRHNILQVFPCSRDLFHFPVKIVNTLTATPDTLQFFVKSWNEQSKHMELADSWSGWIILELYGFAIV